MRSPYVKKWLFVFLLAVGLNWVWENLHSRLYVHFQGGIITPGVLLYAALVDCVSITAIIFFARRFFDSRYWQTLFIVLSGVVASLVLEYRALLTDRWAYTELMPIIPGLYTGLTPTVQLAVTGSIVYWLVFYRDEKDQKQP